MVGVRSKKVTQRNSASKCATFFFITVIEKRDCVDSDNGILWVKMHLKTFFRDTENTIVYLFIQSLKTQSNGRMATKQSPLKTPWNGHWITLLDCSPFQQNMNDTLRYGLIFLSRRGNLIYKSMSSSPPSEMIWFPDWCHALSNFI